MFVLIHVVIALSSIISGTILLAMPTRAKLYSTYGLIGATLVSGTALVIITHSPLLGSCIAGLLYTSLVVTMVLGAQRRMATKRIKNHK